MMQVYLYAFGFILLAIAHLSIHKTRNKTFYFLILLSTSIIGSRFIIHSYEQFQSKKAHQLSLEMERENAFTIRTLRLTQRGLSKMIDEVIKQLPIEEQQEFQIDQNLKSFATHLPEKDFLLKEKPFDKCAVVGNSAVLRGTNFGKEIDSNDLVMRFNYPPLENYEKDVGNKTDWIFTGGSTELQSNHHPFKKYNDYPKSTKLMLFPPSLERIAAIESYFKLPDMRELNFVAPYFVDLVNRAFISYLRQMPGGYQRNAKGHSYRASSGLRGVLAGMLICNQTTVYGFGASKKYGHGHYYAQSQGIHLENMSHNFTLERLMMQDLSNEKVFCKDLRPLKEFRCGAVRVETTGVVDIGSLFQLAAGAAAGISGRNQSHVAAAAQLIAHVASDKARNRTVEWAKNKAKKARERKAKKEARKGSKKERTNCNVVRRPDGDIWRCHFFSAENELPSNNRGQRRSKIIHKK